MVHNASNVTKREVRCSSLLPPPSNRTHPEPAPHPRQHVESIPEASAAQTLPNDPFPVPWEPGVRRDLVLERVAFEVEETEGTLRLFFQLKENKLASRVS